MSSDTTADEPTRFIRSCTIVPLVILVYDTFLTFSREVDCIWKRKFSAVTMLYVLQRYSLILAIILRQPIVLKNLIGCRLYAGVLYTTDILSLTGVALFSSLRTWAICGRISVPVILVFLCSIFVPSINIYNYSRPQTFAMVDGSCQSWGSDPDPPNIDYYPIITRSVAILSDVLVLVITWVKSADTLKASIQLQHFKPKMSMMLIRNGTMYFVFLFALNAITLALNVVGHRYPAAHGATSFIYINEAIAPTLIARFILDLRSVYYPTSTNNEDLTGTSSKFSAGPYIGNLAATIGPNSTWISGSSEDAENDQGNRYQESEEPFLVGLTVNDAGHDELELQDLREPTC